MSTSDVKTKQKNKDVLNVVEDFDCSTQNAKYNKDFKEWRKRKDNPYAFNFKANKKEKVFNDSRGFEKQLPEKAEKTIINRIMYIIGMAMLLLVVIDSIVGKFTVYILGVLGLDLHISILTSALYGNVFLVLVAFMTISVLKLLVPLIYVTKKLKMPCRIAFMSKVNSSVEILNAIGLALIACTVVCLPTAYSSDSKEIFAFVKSVRTDVAMWDSTEFIIYAMFSIIVLPVLFELFIHGPIFTALRQFGDIFAIGVTTAVACFITRDFAEVPAVLIITVIAAVSMLRSGTIMAAILVNITYRVYSFALINLEVSNSANMLIKRNIFMLSTLVAGIVISGMVYLSYKIRKRSKHYIAAYSSGLSPARRFYVAARSYPFLAVVVVCIIDAAAKIVF